MAETIPFGIATNILTKLGSSTFHEIGLVYGVKDELRKLENTLSTIKAVLLDAEEKQEKSHLVQDWMRKLKDVVYDADDVLDKFATKSLRRKMETQGRIKEQVREFLSASNQLAFRYKMGLEIKEIRERLEEVAADISKFNFTERSVNIRNIRVENKGREQTHSFVLPSAVIGRDKDKEEIVKLLMCSSNQEMVSVVPIVGIGGLGKTALAKLVYNDERAVKNFELRMWVWAFGEFDVKLLAEKIITSAANTELENLEMDQLQNLVREKLEMDQLQILLRKKLEGKRYLLVLDDVWNENHERWVQLKDLLMGGANGSKILVTTRSKKVSSVMDIESPYNLEGLPKDKCWTLFNQLVFKEGQEEEHPNLVAIGKNIVQKCQGVPLAIRTLGSMMRYKTEEIEWLSVQNSEIWELPKEDNDILSILKLSYDHMPIYLQQCFAYCALFPKGYEIEKKRLVQLWMAQGYIHPQGRDRHLEDIGDQYLKELVLRSFFQEVTKDDYDNIISCRMHELIHDLAQSVAGTECLIVHVDAINISERVHHVSFNCHLSSTWEVPSPLLKAKKIRTFILPVQYHTYYISTHDTVISCFRSLRVLDLHNSRVEKVPSAIGKMNHLRYLDLSGNVHITTLPASISKLQNLQTLKLQKCYKLKELPRDIRKMINLRHLEINGCSKLTHMPSGLVQLTSLQTLPRFILGKNSSNSRLIGGLSELNGLNFLRGELRIDQLEHVKNATSESKEANLKGKQYLQALRLYWYREDDDGGDADTALLEGLQPHQNLKELHIYGYGGVRFSSWMMATMVTLLPNLVEITFQSCVRCQHLPPFGQLPSLKVLKLYILTALEYINNNNTSSLSNLVSGARGCLFFPSLKELVLYELPLLKEWPREVVVVNEYETATAIANQQQQQQISLLSFPCLTQLTIVDCPSLMSIPSLPHLEELVIENFTEKLLQSLMMVAATSSPTTSSSLARLKSLKISSCKDLVSLPEEGLQNLTSLERLEISCCENLTSLPEGMHFLVALQELIIFYCEHLSQRYGKETGEDWPKIAHIPNIYFGDAHNSN